MKKLKAFEGAVNIEADITPITRQKIDQVYPDKWMNMAITELWEQRIVLQNRINLAWASNHAEIVKSLEQGINRIDSIITYKSKNENKTNEENKITLL